MLAVILCAFFVLAGCTAIPLEAPPLDQPLATRLDTAFVDRGPVVAVTRRHGMTRYVSEPLYFMNPIAPFGEFHVLPGDYVVAGQLLVSLDVTNLDEQITNETERISTTRRNYEIANEIRRLNIEIMRLEHQQSLAIAEEDLEDIADANTATTQYFNIQRAVMELRHEQERQARALQRAEERLTQLHAQRIRGQLHAPYDGRITFIADINRGASIGAVLPLLYITDGNRVIVEAIDLIPADWDFAGMRMSPPDPWRPFPVRNAIQTFGHINGQAVELEYIPVRLEDRWATPVQFDTIGTTLEVGQYVSIHFYRLRIDDALRIPANAIFMDADHAYVYRVVDGNMINTVVRLSGRTDVFAAVSYGLEEGDEVFVRP